MTIVLCDCCRKEIATLKDWRETECDNITKFFVCKNCINLTDKYFFKKMYGGKV